MEDGTIADEQINASSVFHNSPLYAGNRGRLHNDQGASSFVGWISGTRNVDQWLQVDMLTQYTRITGVATQGRTNHSQRVKTYQLQFSNNGMEFQYYKERGQNGSKVRQTISKGEKSEELAHSPRSNIKPLRKQADGQTDRQMDGRTDGRADRQTHFIHTLIKILF